MDNTLPKGTITVPIYVESRYKVRRRLIKKTVEALEGSIAGFGENTIIATPSFATIHKESEVSKEEKQNKFDY